MQDPNCLPDEVIADWAERASMTQIDREGFELAAQAGARTETARIVFDEPVNDAQELRKAMVVLARRARERQALRDDARYE